MYNRQNLPLSPRKIIKKSISNRGVIFYLPLISFFTAWFIIGTNRGWDESDISFSSIFLTALSIYLLFVILVIIYEYFYYKLYYYDFREGDAEVRKGVIARSTGYIRYERLQNIYIDQDILDRLLGLYDVHYETAGEKSGIYSHVDGLVKENADKLAVFLKEKAKTFPPHIPSLSAVYPNTASAADPSLSPSQENGHKLSSTEYPISSKVIIAKGTTLSTAFLAVLGFIMLVGVSEEAGDLLAITFRIFAFLYLLLTIGAFIYSYIWYKNFFFSFGRDKGVVRTKVIAQSMSYLFYDRIQDVQVHQGIISRLLGIYDLRVETAGTVSSSRFTLPGFTRERAEDIRNFLLEKAKLYRQRL